MFRLADPLLYFISSILILKVTISQYFLLNCIITEFRYFLTGDLELLSGRWLVFLLWPIL